MRHRKWSEKVEAALARGKALKAERKLLVKDLPAALTRVWMPIDNLRRIYRRLLNPNEREVEGVASVWRGEGWTIVTSCDRSGDSRGKGLDAVMAKAREAFPSIAERFGFDFEIRARTP